MSHRLGWRDFVVEPEPIELSDLKQFLQEMRVESDLCARAEISLAQGFQVASDKAQFVSGVARAFAGLAAAEKDARLSTTVHEIIEEALASIVMGQSPPVVTLFAGPA